LAFEYEPEAHSRQLVWPCFGWEVPATHAEQLPWPLRLWKVPAAQLLQALAFAAE